MSGLKPRIEIEYFLSSVDQRLLYESPMHRLRFTLLGALLFFVSLLSNAQDFHVSPQGDDANDGSRERPFQTLARARDAVRTVNRAMKGDVVVHLHEGTYTIKETVAFDARDSGHNGHKVIYQAAPGSKPRLIGGVRVKGWTLQNKAKNIYSAPTTLRPFRQLYVDDAMAIRARHPNRESSADNSPYWEVKVGEPPAMRMNSAHWELGSQHPRDRWSEIEIVMISYWYHQRLRVGSVRTDGQAVEFRPARPEGKFTKRDAFYKENAIIDNPSYFENAYVFIDEAYEWYHDPKNGRVYMAFPPNTDPNKDVRVEFPVTETLIRIEGKPNHPVRNLEFHGLNLQLTNWNTPSKLGVNMTQAAQALGSESPAPMVSVRHAERVAFRGNAFCKAGGNGLELFNADQCDVEGNRFHDIAANGIQIDHKGGSNPPPDKQSVGVAIWNNEGTRCGSHYTNGMFLFANNVKQLTVAHNYIHHLPYSGMQIGNQPGGERGEDFRDIGCGENTIINNHIHHCCNIHGDGGGIYTLGGIQKGTVIEGNYIHDTDQPKWCKYEVSHIYLDNNTSQITVRNNVVKGGEAVERNGSKGNVLSNNTQSDRSLQENAGIKPGYNPR